MKRMEEIANAAGAGSVVADNELLDGHEGEEEDTVGIQVDENTPTLIRKFHVVFSPFAPPSTTDYIITASGVHSLHGSRKILDLDSIIKQRRKRDAILAALADEDDGDVMDKTAGEVGGEVFDDLEGLPAEFWDEKLDGEDDTL
jgi:DNA repair protein RAD57